MFFPKKGVPIRWCLLTGFWLLNALEGIQFRRHKLLELCRVLDFAITSFRSHKNDCVSSLNAGRNLENEGMLAVLIKRTYIFS